MFYVLKDHLGSTRVLASATGVIASYHNYQPFGTEMQSGGNEQITYRYTGQEFNGE